MNKGSTLWYGVCGLGRERSGVMWRKRCGRVP